MISRAAFRAVFAFVLPLAAATATLAPTAAFASPPVKVAASAVTVQARFSRYLVSPHGHVEGLVLADGSAVRMSPRAFAKDAPVLQPGDVLRIEGLSRSTPAGAVLTKALVQRAGVTIADGRNLPPREARGHRGKKGPRTRLAEMTASGPIAALVAGPRGNVDRIILQDGTILGARHHRLASLGLKVGDLVTVTGRGGSYDKGKAIHVRTITLPNGKTESFFKHARKQHESTT